MDGSVFEEKSSFRMLGLTLSSKLDWGSYIVSIAKNASKKIGPLICSMKFLSPEVVISGLVLQVAGSGCSALHGVNPLILNKLNKIFNKILNKI